MKFLFGSLEKNISGKPFVILFIYMSDCIFNWGYLLDYLNDVRLADD